MTHRTLFDLKTRHLNMAPFCTLKIILIGDSGVGKTSLLVRFVDGTFRNHVHRPTIIDLKARTMEIGDNLVKLEIWDTAGQERFRAMSREYYRKADGVLLVYDITVLETYYKMSSWLAEIRNYTDGAAIIVGNKNEDPTARKVQTSVVKSFATQEGLEYMEVSAKSGNNVNKAFEVLVMKILDQKNRIDNEAPTVPETPQPKETQVATESENVIRLTNVQSEDVIRLRNVQSEDVIRLTDVPLVSNGSNCYC